MEHRDQQLQVGEQASAPMALPQVAFDARALTRRQIVVEERGHPRRRPAMVAGEAHPGDQDVHGRFDPRRDKRVLLDCRCRIFVVGTLGFRRAAFAAVAVMFLSAACAAASTQVRVYANAGVIQGLKVRPSTLTMAADGNDTITDLHWSSWGSATAQASGTNHVDNCVPNCAQGHIKKVHVTVRLSDRGRYKGKYVYRCYAVKPAVSYLHHLCLP
jgi:hypothetical protein